MPANTDPLANRISTASLVLGRPRNSILQPDGLLSSSTRLEAFASSYQSSGIQPDEMGTSFHITAANRSRHPGRQVPKPAPHLPLLTPYPSLLTPHPKTYVHPEKQPNRASFRVYILVNDLRVYILVNPSMILICLDRMFAPSPSGEGACAHIHLERRKNTFGNLGSLSVRNPAARLTQQRLDLLRI